MNLCNLFWRHFPRNYVIFFVIKNKTELGLTAILSIECLVLGDKVASKGRYRIPADVVTQNKSRQALAL